MKTVNKKTEYGMTLVEILIALAIFAVLMLFLANSFVNYYDSFNYLQATTGVSQSTGLFINAVSNSIRQASKIITSRSFSGTTYTTDDTTLVLQIPSIDASSNVISATYDYMVFYLDGGNIYWLIEADAASFRGSSLQKLGSDITSLSFTYDNQDLSAATKADISVTAQKEFKGKIFRSSLNQQAYLRNN